MEKYIIKVQYSGYSRGYAIYEVEANSEMEALENVELGDFSYLEPIRDDTEKDFSIVETY